MHAAAGEDGILVVSSLSAERNPCEGVGYLSDTFVHLNHKAGLVQTKTREAQLRPSLSLVSLLPKPKHENLHQLLSCTANTQKSLVFCSPFTRPLDHGRVGASCTIRKPPSCASRAWAFNFRAVKASEGNQ